MENLENSENICLRCKGARLLCGKTSCPILFKSSILKSTFSADFPKLKGKQDIFGASPPAAFVGHFGYPKVNIGPMLPIGGYSETKDTQFLDSPESWFGKPIEEIVAYRSGMIRSNFSIGVKYQARNIDSVLSDLNRTNRKLLEATQELTLASKSVDTEAKMSRIRYSMRYDSQSAPTGPSGRAEKITVIDNVKVLKPVDKVVSDRDLKAADAITGYLFNVPEITVTSMQRLLSTGLLGVKKNRKLVPTRWAITAVDDIIGKKLAKDLHHLPWIDKYYSFRGEYLDNKFLIVMIPGRWAFEMNETWAAQTIWNQAVPGINFQPRQVASIINDFELEKGRKSYASNITGAYYSARKEIEEFLVKIRRQARVIVFREIMGGYLVPLGVWVIRETVRNMLAQGFQNPLFREHETLGDALSLLNEFSVPRPYWIKASNLLPYIKTQRSLDYWLR